jgi:hypothetical protein
MVNGPKRSMRLVDLVCPLCGGSGRVDGPSNLVAGTTPARVALAVCDAAEMGPSITYGDIQERTGLVKSQIQDALVALDEAGVVRRGSRGSTGQLRPLVQVVAAG